MEKHSKNHQKFNKKTEEAIKEAKAIISGKQKAEKYLSAKELFKELDKEK